MVHGPAKLIDPQTGKVRGYQDPSSRKIYESWPPPPDEPREVVYFDFREKMFRNYPKLRPSEKKALNGLEDV